MKTKNMMVILVLALDLVSVSLATEGIWTTKTNMPTARYIPSSSVVDGKIYVIAGTSGSACLSTVEAYNPLTDTWTRKANLPMITAGAAGSAVNGRIYVMGGVPSLWGAPYSSVEEYDATTDTWTAKADMPTARGWVSSSVVNGKIYAIGGASGYQGTPHSTVEEYDPATDTWTRKADMPTARACLCTSAVNGKIYAIGGCPGFNEWSQSLSTVEEYNPATDTWTRKADMPTPRTYISTCALNGKIYAFGGLRSRANHVSPVEEYDPATDTWTTKSDIPTARSGVATSAVNGKIYAIGGWVGTSTVLTTVEEYDPYPLVVDFNGDEIVNFKDFSMLAQYWYRNDSPFVNHRMDYEYLAAFAEYWIEDFRLFAHWKLDETEGTIAYESIGSNDGTVNGETNWQPTNGKVDGALKFNGADNYISTDFVLNPVSGFSAFAWVKGGEPGQVIISQADKRAGRNIIPGSTWLGTDPSDGKLTTSIMDLYFPPLESESIITDGQWHHVGLVYDFEQFHRHLYVDGVEVAKDTSIVGGISSTSGLYIGAGKAREEGSFFSGLIDDVRIYNQALSAKEIEELMR
ncbi:MAG: Kelch repeat-containing protein [Planctomycetota bacterium]|jgi:N-acetylneuraminic acid mutarotase